MGIEAPERASVNGDGFRCGYCDAPIHDLDRALVASVRIDRRGRDVCALVHAECVGAFAEERPYAWWYRDHPVDLMRGTREDGRRFLRMLSRGPEDALESMRVRLREDA